MNFFAIKAPKKILKITATGVTYGIGCGILGFLVWAYYPTWTTSGVPLVFKIEGALPSKINFRDAGASINQCAGTALVKSGLLFRAAGFFSGWSCNQVGNPDMILTLNFSDAENRRYYCRRQEGLNIGVTYQTRELNDLEFLTTWDQQPEMVANTCQFLKQAVENQSRGKSTLIQCDAGRDRTGAVIALLAALEIESQRPLVDSDIAAIECDYRKSPSLKPAKYGRIETLLKTLRSQGGVTTFLQQKCHWSR